MNKAIVLFWFTIIVCANAWSLNAPTSLNAIAQSSSEIKLSFVDNSSLESGFIIERSLLQSSGFAEIARTVKDGNSFLDTGLNSNTKYYYRVRAFRLKNTGLIFSSYTNIASALTLGSVTNPPSYTYSYVVGAWSACSATACATQGTQIRSVTCTRNDGVAVTDSYCTGTKPATSQPCSAPACPPPTGSLKQISGVTITNPWNQMSAIMNSLSSLAYKPTARVVFDEFMAASEYKPMVEQIHQVSFVMGEILDSFYMPQYSTLAYINRTKEYLNSMSASVDIWEIGNEINGEWLGDTASVVAKMSGAYDVVKAAGKTTALTLYYNKNCWEKADHEMFTWAQANVPDRMKTGLDYVLISFYEDDCNGIQPDWNQEFQKLGAMFPNSKIGFGETGTIYTARKADYINRYYRDMVVSHPRFIGGYFWWYFDAQQNGGVGDLTPKTNYLWDVLNNATLNSAMGF